MVQHELQASYACCNRKLNPNQARKKISRVGSQHGSPEHEKVVTILEIVVHKTRQSIAEAHFALLQIYIMIDETFIDKPGELWKL